MNRRGFLGTIAGATGTLLTGQLLNDKSAQPKESRLVSADFGHERSRMTYCFIAGREGPRAPLFYFPENPAGYCIVNLDGYAIVPLEQMPKSWQKKHLGSEWGRKALAKKA